MTSGSVEHMWLLYTCGTFCCYCLFFSPTLKVALLLRFLLLFALLPVCPARVSLCQFMILQGKSYCRRVSESWSH